MSISLGPPRPTPRVIISAPGSMCHIRHCPRTIPVHQAVHIPVTSDHVVDRGAGAGVEVTSNDDHTSGVGAGVVGGKLEHLGCLLLSDCSVI